MKTKPDSDNDTILYKDFVLEKNRSLIDLKIFVIDFNNTRNLDRFLGTIAKILIANTFLQRGIEGSNEDQESGYSLVNFTGTYEKSRRIFSALGQIFDLVEERNTKTITSGSFGFLERLKIFLSDDSKSGPIFKKFLAENNITLENLYSLKQKEIESLITITSSRGVAKVGISLKSKNLAIYRFDDFLSTDDLNFNPLLESGQELEEWKSKFESQFGQLAGRVACLGKDPQNSSNKRCAILARLNNQKNIVEDPELDTLTWVDCIQIFEQIPSVVINDEVIFCSHKGDTSIRHDLSFKRNAKYNNRTRDVNKNTVIELILQHVGILDSDSKQNKSNLSLDINSDQTFDMAKKKIKEQARELHHFFEKNNIETENVNVIWSTNVSHLFANISRQSIEKTIVEKRNKYDSLSSTTFTFHDFLLEDWIITNKNKNARRRTKRMSISLNRAFYRSMAKEFAGNFTSDQLVELVQILRADIKNKTSLQAYVSQDES